MPMPASAPCVRAGSAGVKRIAPALSTPTGTVTMQARALSVPDAVVIATPGPSQRIAVTVWFSRMSSPAP